MQVEITIFNKKYTLIHLATYRKWKYSQKPIDNIYDIYDIYNGCF